MFPPHQKNKKPSPRERMRRVHWEGFVAGFLLAAVVPPGPRYWGLLLQTISKQFKRVNDRTGDSARRHAAIHRLSSDEAVRFVFGHAPRRHQDRLGALHRPCRAQVLVETLDLAAQTRFVTE